MRETKAIDRRAEAGGFIADAEVAGTRDLQAAADAGALDHGDRRVRAIGDGV